MDSFRILETQVSSLPALGRLIRQRRKSSNLRIDDAAALCGVSVGTMSRLETGKASVSASKVLQVLDRLGLVMLVLDKERLRRLASTAQRTEP